MQMYRLIRVSSDTDVEKCREYESFISRLIYESLFNYKTIRDSSHSRAELTR